MACSTDVTGSGVQPQHEAKAQSAPAGTPPPTSTAGGTLSQPSGGHDEERPPLEPPETPGEVRPPTDSGRHHRHDGSGSDGGGMRRAPIVDRHQSERVGELPVTELPRSRLLQLRALSRRRELP